MSQQISAIFRDIHTVTKILHLKTNLIFGTILMMLVVFHIAKCKTR